MGALFNLLTPFFTPIFEFFKNLAMGIFIYRSGVKSQQLANEKQENKNAKEAAKTKSSITSMSDAELTAILSVPKTDKRNNGRRD